MLSHYLTHPIPPVRKHSNRDPQKYKLFKMEREFVGTCIYHVVAVEDLQRIADHACREHKVLPPKITVFRESGKRPPDGWYLDGTIGLNGAYSAQNTCVLLHELAHHIHSTRCPDDTQDHGPMFCRFYADLLDRYRILPFDCFCLLADRWGVEVS